MTRKNRDSPGDNPKRITDYFARNKPSSAENIATTSLSAPDASTRRGDQKSEEPVALRKSSRPTRAPLRRDVELIAAASSKRLRSPDVTSPRGKTARRSGGRSKQSKRQKKFESDSDVDMAGSAVIYVRSPGRAGNPGKPSVLDHTIFRRLETVSTSQSDEVELDSARITSILGRDTYEVRMCVEKWRQQAPLPLSPIPGDEDIHMEDVKMEVFSPLTSVHSTPKSSVSDHSNVNFFVPCLPTPPISEDLIAQPPSPVPVDEKTQTELLIEKMKNDATARVQQLRDSPPPQFNETLDSSSDEGDLAFTVLVRPKGEERRESNSVKVNTDAPKPASGTQRSLRNRQTAPPTYMVSSLCRSSIGRKGVQLDASIRRKAGTYNPLDILLSEKRKLEKAGKDSQAFIQAESALMAREAWQEDASHDEDVKKWQDEDAARNVIEELLSNDQTSLDGNGTRDISLDAEGAARIIGINDTKVVDILKSDKALREYPQDMLGGRLQLWDKSQTNSDGSISSGSSYSSFQYSGKQPVVGILKRALDEQDCAQVASILNSGYLASIDLSDCEALLLFLCEQAFSSTPEFFEMHAFHALLSIYSDPGSSAARFNATWLFRTLAILGAKLSVMKQMGYSAPSANNMLIDPKYRADAVLRLICVLKTAARSGRIETPDIADILLAIQRIALDPSASHHLCMAVTNLVDELCNLATSDEVRHIYEKVTLFILTLDLSCKVQVASTFSRGSGVARRIARWVAYSVLTNQLCPRCDDEVPPLKGLLDVVESGTMFQIDDESDYTALWHCIRILAIALTDVELYNLAEHGAPNAREDNQTLNKRKSRHKVLLIHEALEGLHATIQDTRALHLDRSRAKAAIQQLSLRLRYQHADFTQDRAIAMPRKDTLKHFFSPKKT